MVVAFDRDAQFAVAVGDAQGAADVGEDVLPFLVAFDVDLEFREHGRGPASVGEPGGREEVQFRRNEPSGSASQSFARE